MMTGSALKSMTGFAQARVEHDGWVFRLSLRSVNHRFLDMHLRLPEGFEPLESRIRQVVRERLRRGHVDVTLRYEPTGPAAVGVNRDVAAAYLKAAEDLRVQFKMKAEPDLGAILRLPGVVAPPTASVEQDWEQLLDLAANCLREALDRLDQMRQVEGRALGEELSRRLRHIGECVREIEGLASRARPAYAKRLETRLKELLSETQLDPARLAQEAAIAAERSDVSEELARLGSHVQQFEKILSVGVEAGKKLDFLLQEMQREANTLLSKTPGTEEDGLAMASLALDVKGEIEKLREQVQNLE
jgi:uncharacterized protein (TIGR00255 family)